MSDAERGAYGASGAGSGSAPTATVSSLKSEDSTEQLICNTPQNKTNKIKEVKELSVTSKSVEAGSDVRPGRRRLVVLLGLAQVALGALLVGAGAMAVVKGAALSRVGAGLWAGCVAVVAGVVGVLAGINDCYGLYGAGSGSPLLTAFLALSLLCLACGNSAAVLAATGLQRDSLRAQPSEHASFEDEMQAWTPVLTNIALLIIATLHCLVSVVSIYHLSKRVCPCFRKKPPFDHNQFDPAFKVVPPYVIHLDEKKAQEAERARHHHLCKELEVKLQGDKPSKKKDETGEFDSANSKEKLVTRWLGRHHSVADAAAAAAAAATSARAGGARGERPERGERAERRGVRKQRARPPPVVLLPAHPASTQLDHSAAECEVLSVSLTIATTNDLLLTTMRQPARELAAPAPASVRIVAPAPRLRQRTAGPHAGAVCDGAAAVRHAAAAARAALLPPPRHASPPAALSARARRAAAARACARARTRLAARALARAHPPQAARRPRPPHRRGPQAHLHRPRQSVRGAVHRGDRREPARGRAARLAAQHRHHRLRQLAPPRPLNLTQGGRETAGHTARGGDRDRRLGRTSGVTVLNKLF